MITPSPGPSPAFGAKRASTIEGPLRLGQPRCAGLRMRGARPSSRSPGRAVRSARRGVLGSDDAQLGAPRPTATSEERSRRTSSTGRSRRSRTRGGGDARRADRDRRGGRGRRADDRGLHRVARHESGHAVAAHCWAAKCSPSRSTIRTSAAARCADRLPREPLGHRRRPTALWHEVEDELVVLFLGGISEDLEPYDAVPVVSGRVEDGRRQRQRRERARASRSG